MACTRSGDPTIISALRRAGPSLVARAAWSVLLERRRSLAEDAALAMARIDRPVRIEGVERVPARDPFVVVANHYQAPGLWIGWVAAAITDAIARARRDPRQELHWMVLSEWRWFEVGRWWVPNPATALLFPRACRVWGLIATSTRPSDVAGRARGVRQSLSYLKPPGPAPAAIGPVGVFPEGRATVALEEAKPGTGAFLHRISRMGVPLLPVGVHQAEGTLLVRFGDPFLMGDPPSRDRGDLDGWARRRVMAAIATLLPPRLWGAYAADIEGGEERNHKDTKDTKEH